MAVVKYSKKRSVLRLAQLGLDPIEELVKLNTKLDEEIKTQEDIRDANVKNSLGKAVSYRAEAHLNLFDKKAKVLTSLLPYAYGDENESDEKPTIVVKLT